MTQNRANYEQGSITGSSYKNLKKRHAEMKSPNSGCTEGDHYPGWKILFLAWGHE